MNPKHPHILNAASNLLGIALVIIAGLHVSNRARTTFADEVAWAAAVAFAGACLLSYGAMRHEAAASRLEMLADRTFLFGMAALFLAVVVLALSA